MVTETYVDECFERVLFVGDAGKYRARKRRFVRFVVDVVCLMAIWGHTEVHVEKVVERRVWIVSTVHNDPSKRQMLTEVKWEDAFKTFPYAPDYGEAVATCQSHEDTMLTLEEEDLVEAFTSGKISRDEYEGKTEVKAENVVSLLEFKRRKK